MRFQSLCGLFLFEQGLQQHRAARGNIVGRQSQQIALHEFVVRRPEGYL